jgi:hypothetical protein
MSDLYVISNGEFQLVDEVMLTVSEWTEFLKSKI